MIKKYGYHLVVFLSLSFLLFKAYNTSLVQRLLREKPLFAISECLSSELEDHKILVLGVYPKQEAYLTGAFTRVKYLKAMGEGGVFLLDSRAITFEEAHEFYTKTGCGFSGKVFLLDGNHTIMQKQIDALIDAEIKLR